MAFYRSGLARTGASWRDLPAEFGKWFSAYTRFWRWPQKRIWERIFKLLSDDPDLEYVRIDVAHIRVHQRGTAQRAPQTQVIGQPRGGLTTKIAALVGALGNLVRFVLLPGQQHHKL